MKKLVLIFLFVNALVSCKSDKAEDTVSNFKGTINPMHFKKKSDSIFIPKYAIIKPNYSSNANIGNVKKYKEIRQITNNFLEVENNEEGEDAYGVPDYDFEGLSVYSSSEYPTRREIYFFAKRINKEYSFFYEKDKLLLVLEGEYLDNGFKGDSLFFYNESLFLWKNTSNMYVNNKYISIGKNNYILRLNDEINEIIENGFTIYIENYNYKKDSLSSFVIGNLKAKVN